MGTNCMSAVLSLLDLVLFKRLNVRLGIPDYLFVIGNGALEALVGQWQWMPLVVATSYACPPGMEAIIYSLLAGCSIIGQVVAANFGALLLDVLNCNPSGLANEGDQFTN